MSDSITKIFLQFDRRIKGVLRGLVPDDISQAERHTIGQIKTALNEIRLDVRDYEYAETRAEQEKWMKLGRHNLTALDTLLLRLEVFGPADVAELSAYIDQIRSRLR